MSARLVYGNPSVLRSISADDPGCSWSTSTPKKGTLPVYEPAWTRGSSFASCVKNTNSRPVTGADATFGLSVTLTRCAPTLGAAMRSAATHATRPFARRPTPYTRGPITPPVCWRSLIRPGASSARDGIKINRLRAMSCAPSPPSTPGVAAVVPPSLRNRARAGPGLPCRPPSGRSRACRNTPSPAAARRPGCSG